jgi:hypothetical protein
LAGALRRSPSASTHRPPIATSSRPGKHRPSSASTKTATSLPRPSGWPGSQTTQATAARADYGVALLPRYIGATHEPDLVQVSLGERLPERDVWLLTRRDLTKVPRVRAVDRLSRRGVLARAATVGRLAVAVLRSDQTSRRRPLARTVFVLVGAFLVAGWSAAGEPADFRGVTRNARNRLPIEGRRRSRSP